MLMRSPQPSDPWQQHSLKTASNKWKTVTVLVMCDNITRPMGMFVHSALVVTGVQQLCDMCATNWAKRITVSQLLMGHFFVDGIFF